MKLTGRTCYSHLLWLMCSGELLEQAVHRVTFKQPNFSHEGIAGYIETDYEIEIKDLSVFDKVWKTWYSLPNKRRLDLYGLAKGLGDCK